MRASVRCAIFGHPFAEAPLSGPHSSQAILNRNANCILKGSLASRDIVGPERYALYLFRRGGIVEIKRSCSTVGVIFGTGGWAAAWFKAYLSLPDGEDASERFLNVSNWLSIPTISTYPGRENGPPPHPHPLIKEGEVPLISDSITDVYPFRANGESSGRLGEFRYPPIDKRPTEGNMRAVIFIKIYIFITYLSAAYKASNNTPYVDTIMFLSQSSGLRSKEGICMVEYGEIRVLFRYLVIYSHGAIYSMI